MRIIIHNNYVFFFLLFYYTMRSVICVHRNALSLQIYNVFMMRIAFRETVQYGFQRGDIIFQARGDTV